MALTDYKVKSLLKLQAERVAASLLNYAEDQNAAFRRGQIIASNDALRMIAVSAERNDIKELTFEAENAVCYPERHRPLAEIAADLQKMVGIEIYDEPEEEGEDVA